MNFNVVSVTINIFSVIAALVSLFLSFSALDTARTYNRLSFPANMKVRNVDVFSNIRSNEITSFVPNMPLEIEANIINFGQEQAFMDSSACFIYWHAGKLPMLAPFSGLDMPCLGEWKLGDGAPGAVFQVKIHAVVPKDYKPDMKLYFMGYIRYHDHVSPNLALVFAKVFDPDAGRFVAVKDNPDYEYETTK